MGTLQNKGISKSPTCSAIFLQWPAFPCKMRFIQYPERAMPWKQNIHSGIAFVAAHNKDKFVAILFEDIKYTLRTRQKTFFWHVLVAVNTMRQFERETKEPPCQGCNCPSCAIYIYRCIIMFRHFLKFLHMRHQDLLNHWIVKGIFHGFSHDQDYTLLVFKVNFVDNGNSIKLFYLIFTRRIFI